MEACVVGHHALLHGILRPRVPHLAVVRDRLAAWATIAREMDGPAFEAHVRDEIASGTPDADTAAAYIQAVPPEQQWLGLDRWWRKRAAA